MVVVCYVFLFILSFHRKKKVDACILITRHLFAVQLEEAKLLRAQGQHDMAISLGKYILQKHSDKKDISDVYRLVGKWLAETRSSK